MEVITILFNVETEVGEVMRHIIEDVGSGVEMSESGSWEKCGLITADRLVSLLDSLPHIKNWMEGEVGENTLH